MNQIFNEDFQEVVDLVESKKPFALLRFADGEIAVMQGRGIIGSDRWSTPNRVTKLGEDLLKAIAIEDESVYIGISCSCCDEPGKEYLLKRIKNKKSNITFSNIFVNGNYTQFTGYVKTVREPVNLIANVTAKVENCPFKVKTFLPIPDDCVNYYEEVRDAFLGLLEDSYKEVKGELFFVSAGPMSEAIISHLWKVNPHNRYVDVGSSIAEFIHGKPIREFAYVYSPFHNKNCTF